MGGLFAHLAAKGNFWFGVVVVIVIVVVVVVVVFVVVVVVVVVVIVVVVVVVVVIVVAGHLARPRAQQGAPGRPAPQARSASIC